MRSMVFAALVFCLALSGRANAAARPQGEMSAFFHWQPAANATGWLLFLPGADGLRILKDDQHYFNVAQRLNRRALSAASVELQLYPDAYHQPAAIDAERRLVGFLANNHALQPDTPCA